MSKNLYIGSLVNKDNRFGRLFTPSLFLYHPSIYDVLDIGYTVILIKYLKITYQAEDIYINLKDDLYEGIKSVIEGRDRSYFKSKSYNAEIDHLNYEYNQMRDYFNKEVFELFDNLTIENLYIDKELIQQIFDEFSENTAKELIELITKHNLNTEENLSLFKEFIDKL